MSIIARQDRRLKPVHNDMHPAKIFYIIHIHGLVWLRKLIRGTVATAVSHSVVQEFGNPCFRGDLKKRCAFLAVHITKELVRAIRLL